MINQKGFTPIIILIAILIVSTIAGGAYYLGGRRTSTPAPSPSSIPVVASRTPRATVTPSSVPDETANGKTYTDKDHGFSFKYSSALKVLNDYPFFKAIDINSEDDQGVNSIILSISSPSDDSYSTYANRFKKYLQLKIGATLQDDQVKVTRYSDVNVDGVNATIFHITTIPELAPGGPPPEEQVIFTKNNTWYNFQIDKQSSEFINYLNGILSTFKFL